MATKEWVASHKQHMREYRQGWYQRNKEKVLLKNYERKRETAKWLREYKMNLKCSTCPETHPSCLEFHHIDPSKKDNEVSAMLKNRVSKKVIMDEINKCLVLCSNCHKKHHHNERMLLTPPRR